MILLLGGTAETAGIADNLAKNGWNVLVSTATDVPLKLKSSSKITRRCGRLNTEEMTRLSRKKHVSAIIDATHPYAVAVGKIALDTATRLGIPLFSFTRQSSIRESEGIRFAKDHTTAAQMAFAFHHPVFLTTGSLNLAPYAAASKATNLPLVVRVLDHADALVACQKAGIPQSHILAGRGPFSVEDNLSVIDKFEIGVLVTKDGGTAGGVEEKLEAARQRHCRVVAIQRPPIHSTNTYFSVDELIQAISATLAP